MSNENPKKKTRRDMADLFDYLNLCIASRDGEIGSTIAPAPKFLKHEDGLYSLFRDGRRFKVRVIEVDGEEP